MTMTTGERVAYLVERAIEATPGTIEPEVLAALPAIFRQLIGEMAAWRRGEADVKDLPLPLRISMHRLHCRRGRRQTPWSRVR